MQSKNTAEENEMQGHHLIMRMSALKWNLPPGSDKGEWYCVALGNHGMTMIQQHSVMLRTKSRMDQLIWYCEDGEVLMSL